MRANTFEIRPLEQSDHAWVREFIKERWGSERQIRRGELYYPAEPPGFAAFQERKPVGLVTYHIDGDQCEVSSLDSLIEGQGVGTALMEAVIHVATSAGCRRLWLITTNDNLKALRFYQKWNMTITAINLNALKQSR